MTVRKNRWDYDWKWMIGNELLNLQCCVYAPLSDSCYSFSWQFIWPPAPNECLLNWSGRRNTTHYTLCTVQKPVAKKCHTLYCNLLSFYLVLHCFPLCPLYGLAERCLIFWRSTQPTKMIPHRQTARGATFERQRQRMNMCVCVSACLCVCLCLCDCALWVHVFIMWYVPVFLELQIF